MTTSEQRVGWLLEREHDLVVGLARLQKAMRFSCILDGQHAAPLEAKLS